jgi:hypothetical protein
VLVILMLTLNLRLLLIISIVSFDVITVDVVNRIYVCDAVVMILVWYIG